MLGVIGPGILQSWMACQPADFAGTPFANGAIWRNIFVEISARSLLGTERLLGLWPLGALPLTPLLEVSRLVSWTLGRHLRMPVLLLTALLLRWTSHLVSCLLSLLSIPRLLCRKLRFCHFLIGLAFGTSWPGLTGMLF